MNQNPESFQNQPLSDAEKRRLESEIAKNEAERRKLIAEAQEVEKRVRQKSWLSEPVVKVVGVVGAAFLFVFWLITYLNPILNKKQELAKIENAIVTQKNERISGDLSEIRLRFEDLSNSYDSLVNKANFTDQERAKLQGENNALKRDLEQVRRDLMEVGRRPQIISSPKEPQFKTIHFDSTSSELRPDAKASLNENFKTLQEFSDIKIRIEAYGDGVMWNISMEHRQHPGFTYQTFSSRDSVLADKRARKVMDYLTMQGISASRIAIIGHPGEPQSTRRQCRFVVVKQ